MKLDALIAFSLASNRNMKLYFTSRLSEHYKHKSYALIITNSSRLVVRLSA